MSKLTLPPGVVRETVYTSRGVDFHINVRSVSMCGSDFYLAKVKEMPSVEEYWYSEEEAVSAAKDAVDAFTKVYQPYRAFLEYGKITQSAKNVLINIV